MVIIYTVCSGVSVIMCCALALHRDDAKHSIIENFLPSITKFAKNSNCFRAFFFLFLQKFDFFKLLSLSLNYLLLLLLLLLASLRRIIQKVVCSFCVVFFLPRFFFSFSDCSEKLKNLNCFVVFFLLKLLVVK